mmetsp:Transcript_121118/g.353936  ORF Transcript_121118/g.353936 Transcript_121118/m.353936 type:complete len:205 (-) Transcript_121118:233-847(-)
MAKITDCPQGHQLQAWIARSGMCDGCGRQVFSGEKVMDCRQCNWYLCDDCAPQHLADYNWWTAVSSIFNGLTVQCTEVQGQKSGGLEEIVVEPRWRRRTPSTGKPPASRRSRLSPEPREAVPDDGASSASPEREDRRAAAREAAKPKPAPPPLPDLLDLQQPELSKGNQEAPLDLLTGPGPQSLEPKFVEGCRPSAASRRLGGA